MNYLISELGSIPDAVEFMPSDNIAYMEFGDVLTHSSLTLGYDFYDFYNNMVEREVNTIMDYKASVSFEIYDVSGIIAASFATGSLVYGFITLYLIKYSETHHVPKATILLSSLYSMACGVGSTIFGFIARRSLIPSDKIVGVIALVIGVVSILLSVLSLVVR